jgi:predicted DNA-binding transcriptional regulator YafY
MRAARLLSILLQLQVYDRITAAELAEQLEVSERTIYRDMEALSAAGIPVVADRGVGGGWYLLDEYRTNLTGLHEDEIHTLFLSNSAQLLADLGLQGAADKALLKLMASLPARQRRNADYMRQRIHVDSSGWHAITEDLSWLPVLQEAIGEERKVELTYQRGHGTSVLRIVEPLGLVAKGSIWYLVAAVEGEFRTYRVSRVQNVRITEHSFSRPEGFDLAEHWEMSTAHFLATLPKYEIILRVDASIVDWLRALWRYAHITHTEPVDSDGWQVIHASCETQKEAIAYVLGCGPRAQVVAPEELQQVVAKVVAQMAVLYR